MNLAEQIKALTPPDLKYFGLDTSPKLEYLKLSNVHDKGFSLLTAITSSSWVIKPPPPCERSCLSHWRNEVGL